MIRKGSNSLTNMVLMTSLIIGMFMGMYLWMDQGLEDSEQTTDQFYESMFTNLSQQQTSLDNLGVGLRNDVRQVKEASSIYQVAISGFKGLGKVLLAPIVFVDTGISVVYILLTGIEIPSWAHTMIIIITLILTLFLIIGILKGDQKL